MCGRYTLSTPSEVLDEVFELEGSPSLSPRFNIAPTQEVAIIRQQGASDHRELSMAKWGLIPSWAKDRAIGNRMINARAETAAEKPSFRAAFKRRRCLIPADGFYEWVKVEDGKQPFYIGMGSGQPFAFAGLWEEWKPRGDAEKAAEEPSEPIVSCTILTTTPNTLMQRLHHRMPVILPAHHYPLWLDPSVQQRERLEPLLTAYPPDEMDAYPVSRLVNNPRNESPRCVEAVH